MKILWFSLVFIFSSTGLCKGIVECDFTLLQANQSGRYEIIKAVTGLKAGELSDEIIDGHLNLGLKGAFEVSWENLMASGSVSEGVIDFIFLSNKTGASVQTYPFRALSTVSLSTDYGRTLSQVQCVVKH
ncbi:hypothetical protein D3C87_260360 [compost metagenome]